MSSMKKHEAGWYVGAADSLATCHGSYWFDPDLGSWQGSRLTFSISNLPKILGAPAQILNQHATQCFHATCSLEPLPYWSDFLVRSPI